MKKSTIITIIIVLLLTLTIGTYSVLQKNNKNTSNSNNSSDNIKVTDKKFLVVYYLAQNHTKSVAQRIASNLIADTFEIVPQEIYTTEDLNWTNNKSRVSREHTDESLRNIKLKTTKVNNWDSYDTIIIGYPIWWGIAAWPVNTFVKANDFSGKTVIPFCTSASSGLGNSGKNLETIANSGNWLAGKRFLSNESDDIIKEWTDSILKGE